MVWYDFKSTCFGLLFFNLRLRLFGSEWSHIYFGSCSRMSGLTPVVKCSAVHLLRSLDGQEGVGAALGNIKVWPAPKSVLSALLISIALRRPCGISSCLGRWPCQVAVKAVQWPKEIILPANIGIFVPQQRAPKVTKDFYCTDSWTSAYQGISKTNLCFIPFIFPLPETIVWINLLLVGVCHFFIGLIKRYDPISYWLVELV